MVGVYSAFPTVVWSSPRPNLQSKQM